MQCWEPDESLTSCHGRQPTTVALLLLQKPDQAQTSNASLVPAFVHQTAAFQGQNLCTIIGLVLYSLVYKHTVMCLSASKKLDLVMSYELVDSADEKGWTN